MKQQLQAPKAQFVTALGLVSLVSIALFSYGALRNHSWEFNYLIWNLFLAWLPLVFAVRLVAVLQKKAWSSWEGIAWTALWLLFLPNSFYMISDFVHLQEVRRVDLLFDVVMFTSFIYTGVVLGFSSLYLMHRACLQRFKRSETIAIILGTLAICSGAIYVGRDLRWNSWDVVTNPGGLLFDVSDRLLHPSAYPKMFITIGAFFVLLASMYSLMWRGIAILKR